MYYLKRKLLWVYILLVGFAIPAIGQIPEKPNPPRLVNDFADILTPEEENNLEQKLVEFDRQTSTQIVIVTVKDLGGYDPAQFAFELGEKWGVGQKEFDNGVVILVKPTGGAGERKTFIATGYGLESVIPDAIAKRIVEYEMIPEFKKGQFFQGLDRAVSTIMSLATKEFSPEEYAKKTSSEKAPLGGVIFIFILIWLIFRMFAIRSYASVNSLPFWTAFWLMNSGTARGSTWSDFNSGSGTFGGFGGGSFGGGGAGGSW